MERAGSLLSKGALNVLWFILINITLFLVEVLDTIRSDYWDRAMSFGFIFSMIFLVAGLIQIYKAGRALQAEE